jgi:hypothetical protein
MLHSSSKPLKRRCSRCTGLRRLGGPTEWDERSKRFVHTSTSEWREGMPKSSAETPSRPHASSTPLESAKYRPYRPQESDVAQNACKTADDCALDKRAALERAVGAHPLAVDNPHYVPTARKPCKSAHWRWCGRCGRYSASSPSSTSSPGPLWFPCPTSTCPQSLLKRFCGRGADQDDPEDLTGERRLKSACTHIRVRTAGPSAIDRGLKLLLPLPVESSSRTVDRPAGSAEEVEKVF